MSPAKSKTAPGTVRSTQSECVRRRALITVTAHTDALATAEEPASGQDRHLTRTDTGCGPSFNWDGGLLPLTESGTYDYGQCSLVHSCC